MPHPLDDDRLFEVALSIHRNKEDVGHKRVHAYLKATEPACTDEYAWAVGGFLAHARDLLDYMEKK